MDEIDFNTLESENHWEKVFGGIGIVTALIFYVIPFYVLYSLSNGKMRIEKTSGMALFATQVNCTLWFISDFLLFEENSFKIFFTLCNLLGMLISSLAVIGYLYFFTQGKPILFLVYIVTIIDITFEIIYISYDLHDKDRKTINIQIIVKWLAMGFSLLMHFSPGLNIVKVISTKDAEMISFPAVLFGLINSGAWLIYAISHYCRKNEKYLFIQLVVSSTFGAFMCIIQIILHQLFKSKETAHDPEPFEEHKENKDSKENKGSIDEYYKDVIG